MRSTFSSIEHLQELFNIKSRVKNPIFFMYFYESVEFETRQKTTKSLNKQNAVKKLKKIEVYRYKKTSDIQRLIRNNSLVLIP